MRELNERMTVSSRSAVLTALDTFEQALQSVGELEKKAASATQLSWISAAATTHANFVSEVGAQYATAVRGLLK